MKRSIVKAMLACSALFLGTAALAEQCQLANYLPDICASKKGCTYDFRQNICSNVSNSEYLENGYSGSGFPDTGYSGSGYSGNEYPGSGYPGSGYSGNEYPGSGFPSVYPGSCWGHPGGRR